jgi:hypothetical protein
LASVHGLSPISLSWLDPVKGIGRV